MTKKYGSENIKPYNNSERKGIQVEHMFNRIAQHYDRLNITLSFGLDRIWRKKAINFLLPFKPKYILDIATGTGDLAIQMCKKLNPTQIIGADISKEMMKIAEEKVLKEGYTDRITFEYQDCLHLSYTENKFDAVTAAFGVRNYEDIKAGLQEMHRVLKEGGQVVILELSTPSSFPIKQLYQIYAKIVIPTIGHLFSHNNSAYRYLPASIKVVPQGEVMISLLASVGFKNIHTNELSFGICSLYTATK